MARERDIFVSKRMQQKRIQKRIFLLIDNYNPYAMVSSPSLYLPVLFISFKKCILPLS